MKKKKGIRFAALLPAVCMTLSLAACGSKSGGKTQQLSGTVYVPKFVDCELEDIQYVNQICADGQNIFFAADVLGEEKEETWTDPETGAQEKYTYNETRTGLFRMDMESGAAAELENYTLSKPDDSSEGDAYITGLQPGEDGTIWVTEQQTLYQYDLPDGFDEETGNKWDYQTGYEEMLVRRQLDGTGQELDRVDISGEMLKEKLGVEYVGNTAFDKAGNIYVSLENKTAVLDKDLNRLFELEMPMKDMWGSLIQMADGTMAMFANYNDTENDTYGSKLMLIDIEGKSWGTEYELNSNVYEIIPGGGDYLCYYQNGDSIYGLKTGAAEGEKLFSWLSAGMNRNNITGFTFLADGRVAALTQEWQEEGVKIQLAVLTPTDAKTLPEKTTLTMAAMYLSYDVRKRVMEFNQNSDTCRIEVVDYSEYNTGSGESAGLTKLNTEIVAGNVPDLIFTNNLPINRYEAKGILEDLWPYIEADSEIGGREGLMEHVLDAASVDGKLYRVFSSFTILTVAGPKAVTGDRMTWTLADLQAAQAQMPEGCTIFGQDDTKDQMLSQVLSMNMSHFVDWETGKCTFDSDEFKAQLAFCNSFPAEFTWEDDMEYHSDLERIKRGEQMLARLYISGFTYPQLYDNAFDGGCAFIGYPKEDGSAGSCFNLNSGTSLAMSSTCRDKDAAWSFIRQLLLPQASEDNYDKYTNQYYFSGFPVNKSDFDKMKESAMQEAYETDENDQPVLDENGQPVRVAKDSWYMGEGQEDLMVYAATQDDIDRTMALYDSIDSLYGYDDSIYSIIEEQIGAYFAGDKDLDATASEIQNRVQLYMGENM